ncbi:Hpr(Ser) kinase/phosphatase [Breoghania corrubedonensis]|uniref:Hpr(Ser) kinase/phosphatase n=1 Tax=Breoghania corrubedonensis TaxID=665038 RepID=A0A2T5VG76_9HYPH|nr:HPr kinase/phosphatase C-terminal domain-containing protein [Breoghania corrubedonensis]PTW62761.1 Hpr(Ser) kinase/phosphatase [Breoghania corrubedonensis]
MRITAATHATCVVIGTAGVLIRGPSGSGKSALGLSLVEHAQGAGHFAALVGDDRVALEVSGGRLVARVPPAIAGLIEQRGHGIRPMPYLPAAVVRLVVDLVPAKTIVRMPEQDTLSTVVNGVTLARQPAPEHDVGQAMALTLAALQHSLHGRAPVPAPRLGTQAGMP